MGTLNSQPGQVPTPTTIEPDDADPFTVRETDVRLGLRSGEYPWYDAKDDAARPIRPYEVSPPPKWGNGLTLPNPELVLIGLGILLLSVFLIALVEQWRRKRRPLPDEAAGSTGTDGQVGVASRINLLPPEARTKAADPWAEATRLREAGDLAGAVVSLFAGELIAMDRAGRIRLSPGKTGRQLVRSVEDQSLRDQARPTLSLFEAVAYGHRRPGRPEFDRAWTAAHALRDRLAEEVRR